MPIRRPSTELNAALLSGLSQVRVKDTHCYVRGLGEGGQEVGREGKGDRIQECTAGRLPWQVDEVRITQAGVGVINARGNAREGKQGHKSAPGPPC